MYTVFLDITCLQFNRLQYSVNLIFICSGKPRNLFGSPYHNKVILTFIAVSGTKPTVSTRHACNSMQQNRTYMYILKHFCYILK